MTDFRAVRPGARGERGMLPCPFCGSASTLEDHPLHPGIVRIACGNERCGIRPATEYLLLEYADELRAAWNRRSRARRRSVAPR